MAKRQDYIIKIKSARLIVIKGGQSLPVGIKPPEQLRIDSAFSASSAAADATERWLLKTARTWYPSEIHEYTLTLDVFPANRITVADRKSYKVIYNVGLSRLRKPQRIAEA